jgi:uncharacterized cupredoxin-like copper-binding protein
MMLSPSRIPGRLWLAVAAAAVLAVAVIAALGGLGGHSAAAAPVTIVPVVEKDFQVSAPMRIHAGLVEFRVRNDGPDRHEFLIAHTGGAVLPMRSDGLTVDEEAIEQQEPGALEPGEPGTLRNLRIRLTPGRYVFFCNMEGHFLSGMHTEVQVTG